MKEINNNIQIYNNNLKVFKNKNIKCKKKIMTIENIYKYMEFIKNKIKKVLIKEFYITWVAYTGRKKNKNEKFSLNLFFYQVLSSCYNSL